MTIVDVQMLSGTFESTRAGYLHEYRGRDHAQKVIESIELR